jgi:ATP-binding protein involved in chromosome partitioning
MQADTVVRALPGVTSALIALTAERKAGAAAATAPPAARRPAPQGVPDVAGHRPAPPPHGSPMARQAPIPGVRAIIAVASGKGGVGKSTTALNLALGLRDIGLKVGVLDADIYGPSMPKLTGIREKPQLTDAKKMIPIERFGLPIMSIGFLVEEDTPMIWRGPMVMSAITQMLRDVVWGTLDVMVVDMPPGTGDAQLTLAQAVPLKGAIIVSTPQDLALIDARRGLAMFTRVNVPVLGIVENMSYFQCPHCGTRSDIFGHGGARHEAEKLGVPFLGEVPLHMDIRATSDSGTPLVHSAPDSEHAKIYRAIATRVAERLKQGAAG